MNVITDFMRITDDVYIQLDDTWHWWFADEVLFIETLKVVYNDI
jgi:hypothetical protein